MNILKHNSSILRDYPLFFIFLSLLLFFSSCNNPDNEKWATDILGNPAYKAISYGGYRHENRDQVPSIEELKEDMMILEAIDIKILRTYNTQQFEQASRLLQAIHELKTEKPGFEMYVMLGAWIDCEGAFTDSPNHAKEDSLNNRAEIDAAVELATKYPDIVKIIAVGNEAMVHWATSYFVEPGVILKWVNYLQELKEKGVLDERLWITSSDNFASWGGGDESYHKKDLEKLISAVDYISLHTYPFHDTHYNPQFWELGDKEIDKSISGNIDSSMERAFRYAVSQFNNVKIYIDSLAMDKPLHIGETGWSTNCNKLYGEEGSQAADEFKQKLYYDRIRNWTEKEGISCFFFEAFDEPWKDSRNKEGSENHFGLFTVDGKAKYLLWDEVDDGLFNELSRGDHEISKTFEGSLELLLEKVGSPPFEDKKSKIATND